MKRPTGTVDLDGVLLPAARARVSAFDRGFLFGDGLMETMRAYRGTPFALDEHLERLRSSGEILGIRIPETDWRRRIDAVLRRNRLRGSDARVRLTVTRGVAPEGLLLPADTARPTVLITATPVDVRLAALQRRGARAALLPFGRGGFLAEHKTIDYLAAVLGKSMARRAGAHEGLYVDERGEVTEGTTANLFVHRGERLLTPRLRGILPGVTRRLVIALARRAGIAVAETRIRPETLADADEIFLTSAVSEVLPVVAIGDAAVGKGRPGPVTRRLQRLWRHLVRQTVP